MIYLDNAATTRIDSRVIEIMNNSMQEYFGNPSSSHALGRKSRSLLESSRKNIAKHFNVSSAEIIFTSSGTEADNLVLFNAVKNLGVKRIITSKIEHHAVTHTVNVLIQEFGIKVDYVALDSKGHVDLSNLKELLENQQEKTLVSLMYVNNEIGNMLPIKEVADLCKQNDTLFHSDTVQAIGHYPIDLSSILVDFIVGSAHKFHGPKGVGFAFFRKGIGITPMIHGGNQEKGARSSTESIHAIQAMSKALDFSLETIEEDIRYLNDLKSYCTQSLKKLDKTISFNGDSDNLENSSCTILSACFSRELSMLLFQLDIAGFAVSGGSACQSGSSAGSHVLKAINGEDDKRTSVRISFSKHNTKEEIDKLIQKIKELL